MPDPVPEFLLRTKIDQHRRKPMVIGKMYRQEFDVHSCSNIQIQRRVLYIHNSV